MAFIVVLCNLITQLKLEKKLETLKKTKGETK